MLKYLDNPLLKYELQSIFHTLYKINSRWIIDLNIKPKALKRLEKLQDKNLCGFGLWKVSLLRHQKHNPFLKYEKLRMSAL